MGSTWVWRAYRAAVGVATTEWSELSSVNIFSISYL